jgi:hypothetical protein
MSGKTIHPSRETRIMRSRQLGWFALLLTVFVLVGCGASKIKVSGQVLYKGKPLPGGRLTFQPANTKLNSIPAEIDEQGNYEVTLPVGEVKVAVDNRELQPIASAPVNVGGMSGLPAEVMQKIAAEEKKNKAAPPPSGSSSSNELSEGKLRGKYVPIPEKYATVEDSGLSFTVESGKSKQDIELK